MLSERERYILTRASQTTDEHYLVPRFDNLDTETCEGLRHRGLMRLGTIMCPSYRITPAGRKALEGDGGKQEESKDGVG